MQQLLTAKQAADLLTISERHLATLTKRGEIPSTKLGGRRVYDPQLLQAAIQKRMQSKDS